MILDKSVQSFRGYFEVYIGESETIHWYISFL